MSDETILAALGPLAPLYQDPGVLEILVDAPDRVTVERDGRLIQAEVQFPSPAALRETIDALLAIGGVQLSTVQTCGQIRLGDGTRVLAVLPPTAVHGPYLVVRKALPLNLDIHNLLAFGTLTSEAYTCLQQAIAARASILVSGGTGSGKTTFAKILTDAFPPVERVVVVENLFEMQFRHARFVRLVADSSPDLTLTDLVETAARMRPDRLVFGEAQGPEALRMLEVIGLGHDGSLMTIHATSAEDALARLEAYCLMANLGLGMAQIRRVIASALNLITYQQRQPDGRRRLMEIVELRGLEYDHYQLQPLFTYNPEKDRLEASGVKATWE